MNFIKFPYLVQKEILQQMTHSEKFVLSLCSTKTMKLIKLVGWKEVDGITYYISDHDCRAHVKLGRKRTSLFDISPLSFLDEPIKMKFKGVKLTCGFYLLPSGYACPSTQEFRIFNDGANTQIPEEIHRHVLELFGTRLDYSICITNYTRKTTFLPKLTHIKTTRLLSSPPYDVRKFNDFFAASPDQECVIIQQTSGKMGANSKVFNAQHLDIQMNMHMGNECLRYFKGKSLFSKQAIIDNFSVIEFLKKWISNDGFQDLEVLNFYVDDRISLDPVFIKRHFLIKKFDKSPLFNYNQRKAFEKPFIFASQFYIVRDCDGTVASVEIGRDQFTLAVWNMNEKQMRKQMSN